MNYEEFNIVKYIYLNINTSMKYALDMGTLLSDDKQKLRAFKEQIKKHSKAQWEEIGRALVLLGLAEECYACGPGEYCNICSGSRFLMSALIESSEYTENGIAVSSTAKTPKEVKEVMSTLQSRAIVGEVPQV